MAFDKIIDSAFLDGGLKKSQAQSVKKQGVNNDADT